MALISPTSLFQTLKPTSEITTGRSPPTTGEAPPTSLSGRTCSQVRTRSIFCICVPGCHLTKGRVCLRGQAGRNPGSAMSSRPCACLAPAARASWAWTPAAAQQGGARGSFRCDFGNICRRLLRLFILWFISVKRVVNERLMKDSMSEPGVRTCLTPLL